MSKYDENNELRCSFCGKPQSQVKRLISGSGVYICNECIELCQEILNAEETKQYCRARTVSWQSRTDRLPKPKEIDDIIVRVRDRSGRGEEGSRGSSLQPLQEDKLCSDG